MDTIINWMGGYSQEQVAEVIFAIEILPLAKMFYHLVRAYVFPAENTAYHKDAVWGAFAWSLSICLLGYGALWDEENLIWVGGAMTSILAAWTATYIGCRMHAVSSGVIADAKAILSADEDSEESEKVETAAEEPVQAKVDEVIEPQTLDDVQKSFDEKSEK